MWTGHHRQNGLRIEITFLPMSHGPLNLLFLETPHVPHLSSHLLPIEIPPKPIKHYIPLYSSQPTLYNETHQHLGHLHKSVSRYFPTNETQAVRKLCAVKESLKGQVRPLAFNVTKRENPLTRFQFPHCNRQLRSTMWGLVASPPGTFPAVWALSHGCVFVRPELLHVLLEK